MYQFIRTLPLSVFDTDEIYALKNRYNKLATHFNTEWIILTENERTEISTQLNELEKKIKDYKHE